MTSDVIDAVTKIVTSLAIVGGLVLNAIVAHRASHKAQTAAIEAGTAATKASTAAVTVSETLKTATKETTALLTETKTVVDQSAAVLEDVRSKTDGRLTEVIEKTTRLEDAGKEQTLVIKSLRDQIATADAEKARVSAEAEADRRAEERAAERRRGGVE